MQAIKLRRKERKGSAMEASFGDYITKLREDRGLSQHKLAEVTGMTNAAISRLERNQYRSRPTIAAMERLSYGLQIPLAVLIQVAGYDLGLAELEVAVASDNSALQLPIIRDASALITPLVQRANIIGYAAIDSFRLSDGGPNDYFLVKVTDDSMIDANMFPDLSRVLVRKQQEAKSGDIALIAVGVEAAALRFVDFIDNRVVLTGANSAVRPRMVPRATAHILGIAIEIITYRRITKME